MCRCGEYEDPVVTGSCSSCVRLCQNASDDCGRLCPCYDLVQELKKSIKFLNTQNTILNNNNTELLTQNEVLQTQNNVQLAFLIPLACGFVLVIFIAFYMVIKYRRDAHKARECSIEYSRQLCVNAQATLGTPVQSQGCRKNEKLVVNGTSMQGTDTFNGGQANGTIQGEEDQGALQTQPKTFNTEDEDSRTTEDAPMMTKGSF